MSECEVCIGSGQYPVINKHGSTLYSIRCPECFGLGEVEAEATEVVGLPPRSTAATIQSLDHLRDYQARTISHRSKSE